MLRKSNLLCRDKNERPALKISALRELFEEMQWWVRVANARWPCISIAVHDMRGLAQLENSFADIDVDFGHAYLFMSIESKITHNS